MENQRLGPVAISVSFKEQGDLVATAPSGPSPSYCCRGREGASAAVGIYCTSVTIGLAALGDAEEAPIASG